MVAHESIAKQVCGNEQYHHQVLIYLQNYVSIVIGRAADRVVKTYLVPPRRAAVSSSRDVVAGLNLTHLALEPPKGALRSKGMEFSNFDND
ncbi:hypothetical protein C5167_035300 [Papaver somniferum]|uniref:Uncharacterized protein n=1 Tax=Papaver somniferum TaxID=3469 RepID=A0A4Y7KFK0_PAPSO|nr:hypothetical protein C5167_035300 [Papaver somniferum]